MGAAPSPVSPVSAAELAAATVALAASDPVMEALVERHGPCLLSRPSLRRGERGGEGHFAALAESVLYQQLAGSAAMAIHRRFIDVLGGEVSPEAVLSSGEAALRSAGLSRSKAVTILGLAQEVVDGTLDLEGLARQPEDEVVAGLVRFRGIGPWTAHMFCIFTLGRLDVWPATDYGVRKGYARAYGLEGLPSAKVLGPAGDRFRPQRSVAAWYLWRAAEA